MKDMNLVKIFGLSFILHLLLFLLFLFIRMGVDFSAMDFAEVGFVQAGPTAFAVSGEPKRSTALATRPAPEFSAEPLMPAASATPSGKQPEVKSETVREQPPREVVEKPASPAVDLPRRRMLEDDMTPVPRSVEKITPRDEISSPRRQQDSNRPLEPLPETTRESTGDNITAVTEPVGRDGTEHTADQPKTGAGAASDHDGSGSGTAQDRDGSGSSSSISARPGQPFSIEGDAAGRTILNRVIPTYPPGYQREAEIKIRFTVLPDGSVGSMIPMRKGDPVLEETTLNAMKNWRFNALPPGSENKTVQGIITFRYRLE